MDSDRFVSSWKFVVFEIWGVDMNIRVRGILVENDKILLLRRVKNDIEYWVIPGGGVEKGETEIEALKREMKEETGFDVEVGEYSFENNHDGMTSRCYLIKSWDGELCLGGPEKMQMNGSNQYFLEWVKIEELDKINVFPKNLHEVLANNLES